MIHLDSDELLIAKNILDLKNASGSHSPSMFTLLENIPQINLKIDACFLSNPYATDLFIRYFEKELVKTNKLRDVLEFYPSQNQAIAQTISQVINMNNENIFVGNGAIEVIQAVMHNFISGNVIVNIPTFSSYYEFVKPGVEVIYNQLDKNNEYEINANQLIEFVNKNNGKNLIIINPNNPNGGYIKSNDLQFIISELSHLDNIILDESFIHFAYEDEHLNMVSFSEYFHLYSNLIIIKSMSKDFGIAGIRAGYGIMSKEKVEKLLQNGYLWNLNGLSEYFFKLYARPDFLKDYEQVRKKYIIDAQDFFKKLNEIPQIKIYSSFANFALIELIDGSSSSDFVSKMLIKYGIYSRTGNDKIGLEGQFVRISARSKTENETIISAIKNVFN
jgi:histidinol-phosphate/aromatic aminotransferase/cobyric acid decarboxylase-like protein